MNAFLLKSQVAVQSSSSQRARLFPILEKIMEYES